MLARRFAAAVALLMALVSSQLPEFVQQYRQRLGGALDELKGVVAEFDAEVSRLSLSRDQGIARLESNADELAQARGFSLRRTVDREMRLERQEQAFAMAGPVSQYVVFLENFDPHVAARAYAAYQPAVPVTTGGILAGIAGLFGGWSLTHLLVWPFRRRHPRPGQTHQTA